VVVRRGEGDGGAEEEFRAALDDLGIEAVVTHMLS
jgi:hypothetical protein